MFAEGCENTCSCHVVLVLHSTLQADKVLFPITPASELPVCFAHYRAAAKKGLLAYNGFMQLGGGINPDNAAEWLDSGASHLIVTSYIFQDGELNEDRLKELVSQRYMLALLWKLTYGT